MNGTKNIGQGEVNESLLRIITAYLKCAGSLACGAWSLVIRIL